MDEYGKRLGLQTSFLMSCGVCLEDIITWSSQRSCSGCYDILSGAGMWPFAIWPSPKIIPDGSSLGRLQFPPPFLRYYFNIWIHLVLIGQCIWEPAQRHFGVFLYIAALLGSFHRLPCDVSAQPLPAETWPDMRRPPDHSCCHGYRAGCCEHTHTLESIVSDLSMLLFKQ